MNTSKLIDLIDKEISSLTLMLSTFNEEFSFFNRVVNENNFSDIRGLVNLDSHDVLIAYLVATSKKYKKHEIEERLLLNKYFIEDADDEIVDFVYEYLAKKKLGGRVSTADQLLMYSLIESDIIDYDSIKELYENNDVNLFDIIDLLRAIRRIKLDYAINSQISELKAILFNVKKSRKQRRASAEGSIKDDYNIDEIVKDLSEITKYYQMLKSKVKEVGKSINNYTDAKRILSINKNIDLNKVLSLISSEEIKKEFLYQFNFSKKQEFDTLYKEYSRLSQETKLEVQAIFNDYGFDFNGISLSGINKILLIEKEDLKTLLDKIKLLNITDIKVVEYILLNSSYEILDSINALIKDNVLTLEFVNSNPSIFSVDNNVKNNYFKLASMLEFFKREGINPRIFITDLDIYFKEDNIIKANITILRQYNLFSNIKTAKVFDFLTDDNLVKKIDILLELGYEKLLEDNLEILNRSIIQVEKLYILKGMGLLPVDMESLIKVLDDEKFLAFIDNPSEYIVNVVDYHVDKTLVGKVESSNSNDLDNNDNTASRVISIGGVLFSKNRIRRNKQALDNFDLTPKEKQINAVLIGSVLSEEEYEEVMNEISANTKVIKL